MGKTKTENEALIEQMVKDAEKAGEPGELTKGAVVHKGDDEVPSPMIISEVTSAGHCFIYNTLTGAQSVMNLNMLRRKLQLKRADGSPVFTTIRPDVLPKLGEYKCMLHPDSPNRKHFDELGLATCPKAHLNSPYQVRRHMQKKHKDEWKAIEDERIDKERQEDREFQKQLMTKAIEAPLYVKEDKKK